MSLLLSQVDEFAYTSFVLGHFSVELVDLWTELRLDLNRTKVKNMLSTLENQQKAVLSTRRSQFQGSSADEKLAWKRLRNAERQRRCRARKKEKMNLLKVMSKVINPS